MVKSEGIVWVSHGKEIENHVPSQALGAAPARDHAEKALDAVDVLDEGVLPSPLVDLLDASSEASCVP